MKPYKYHGYVGQRDAIHVHGTNYDYDYPGDDEPEVKVHDQNSIASKKSVKKEIKKSTKEKERLPIKVLINCGGTYPTTLNLFLSTYPKFWEYKIYTFLPDPSYKILYEKFSNHTLFTPMIASYLNTSETTEVGGFASMVQTQSDVTTIDITHWIKTNFQEDDHIILKLDTGQKEEGIIQKIGSSGAVKWIDKFYTTAADSHTMNIYADALHKERNKKVNIWDNHGQTYSDFNVMNPVDIPPGGNTIIDTCSNMQGGDEQFALLLYAQHLSTEVHAAIQSILSYANNRRVAISLFLPVDFFKTNAGLVTTLFRKFSVGVFIPTSYHKTANNVSTEVTEFIHYRNLLVEAVHTVKHITRSMETLQFIMTPNTLDDELARSINNDRHIQIFRKANDITHFSHVLLSNGSITRDSINRKPGEYLSIDLTQENSDILSVYMMQRFDPWLLSVHKCQIMKFYTGKVPVI